MKQIKKEKIKVGDFIYLNQIKRKNSGGKYIIKIISMNLSESSKVQCWLLNINLEPSKLTDGFWYLYKKDWKNYDIYKLNKKEILRFKKHLILNELT